MAVYTIRLDLTKQQEAIVFQMAQDCDKSVQEIIDTIALDNLNGQIARWTTDRVDAERKRLGDSEVLARIANPTVVG